MGDAVVVLVPGIPKPHDGLCVACLLPGVLVLALYVVMDTAVEQYGEVVWCGDCGADQVAAQVSA